MDSNKESEALKVFFPSNLVEDRSKEYSTCSFVGWEAEKRQYYVVGAYSKTKAKLLSSLMDSINKWSKLRNVTYMKNGLEYLEDFDFVKKYDRDKGYYVTLNEPKTGRELRNVLVFMYKNTSFDFKSSDLLENLKVGDDVVEEESNCNSDVGSSFIVATSLKNYIDKAMNDKNMKPKKDPCLGFINRTNRKSHLLSLFIYYLYWFFIKLTFYFSILCHYLLKGFEYGGRFLRFFEKNSKFLSLFMKRLRLLSEWHKSYKELLNKTEITEYIVLKNKLTDKALSVYIDMALGFVLFFFFRRMFLENLFYYRILLKKIYIENLKRLFTFLTLKIFVHFKLNNEVSTSLSKFVINKIYLWNYISRLLRPIKGVLFKVLQYTSFFGISGMVAFVSDILSFETAHLFYLYFIILAIMSYCHKYLYSLIQLFKGKKWNILKSELDTNQYTKEQLFIGVVFFVVFSLNYPTIWIFYISIITVLLPILVLKAVILCVVEVTFHMPCYYILHKVFRRNKFTKGVYFKHKFESSKNLSENGELDYLYLEVRPTSICMADRTSEMKREVAKHLRKVSPINILGFGK